MVPLGLVKFWHRIVHTDEASLLHSAYNELQNNARENNSLEDIKLLMENTNIKNNQSQFSTKYH